MLDLAALALITITLATLLIARANPNPIMREMDEAGR